MGPPWGAFCQITLTSCYHIRQASMVYATATSSVSLFSIISDDYFKTSEYIIKLPPPSPIAPSFQFLYLILQHNSDGIIVNDALNTDGVIKIHCFWPTSGYVLETLQRMHTATTVSLWQLSFLLLSYYHFYYFAFWTRLLFHIHSYSSSEQISH